MKKLLLSTALVAATATGALAQTGSDRVLFRDAVDAMEIRASDFIGMRVYASEAAIEADEYEGAQDGWEDIGEINDVILSRDGGVEAVLVDIGGFLGMGERQVAVDMEAVRFVSDASTADAPNDFFLVMNASRADFEASPEYGALDEADAAAVTDAEGVADAPADVADADEATGRDPVVRDGYAAAAPEILTAERLTGAPVYDAEDADIGEVSTLVLDEQGQVTHAVIDVGGFLGIGAKPVALELAQIDILHKADGDDLRVYVPLTREELEALPAFEG